MSVNIFPLRDSFAIYSQDDRNRLTARYRFPVSSCRTETTLSRISRRRFYELGDRVKRTLDKKHSFSRQTVEPITDIARGRERERQRKRERERGSARGWKIRIFEAVCQHLSADVERALKQTCTSSTEARLSRPRIRRT